MDGKRIRPGAQMLATHDYTKNPESPVGNELDVNEGDTLVYLMTNENNEHWWLAEDGKGQVGYVPAAYLKIIRDVTRQEEESDTARKEGYGKRQMETKLEGRYEDVGYVDLWDSFVEKEEMYVRDGLHLSGKGLPFLPRDCQGRLPVAWVKYDI